MNLVILVVMIQVNTMRMNSRQFWFTVSVSKPLVFSVLLLIYILVNGCSNLNQDKQPNKGQRSKEVVYNVEQKNQDVYREYFENESIKFEVPLKNGKQHGFGTWYSRTGDVEAKANFVSGIKIGDCFLFGLNEQIESYIYYDLVGRVMYRVDFAEDGRISDSGSAFPQVFLNTDSIKVGDTLLMELNVINPPNFGDRVLTIGKKVNEQLLDTVEIDLGKKSMYRYSQLITDTSKFEVVAILKFGNGRIYRYEKTIRVYQ